MFELDLKSIEASQVRQDFALLPEGIYAAVAKNCDLKTSRANHPYFAFTFSLESDVWPQCPFHKRQIWETLMITHPNEIVLKIAHKTLADVLVAAGVDPGHKIADLELEAPLHIMDKKFYIITQHRWDKERLEYKPQIIGYVGRGEFEGRNRYGTDYKPPTLDRCVNANKDLFEKAIKERDRAVERAAMLASKSIAKLPHNTPHYSHGLGNSPQSSRIDSSNGFEDVPF